jgi:heme/copper-type cytochrome/quinol oxidase subunit 2
MLRSRRRLLTGALLAAFACVAIALAGAVVAEQGRREFEVVARKYAYRVAGGNTAEIRVSQNDLVHIDFSTEDIPHSFTIEDTESSHYRIMKRAEPGKPVSFDFRADTAGQFRFYCSLTIDEGCKNMQGRLIVQPRNGARAPVRYPAVADRLLRRPAAPSSAGG